MPDSSSQTILRELDKKAERRHSCRQPVAIATGMSPRPNLAELPDPFSAKPGFLLAQVIGESMNKCIPNGWANPRNSTFSQASPKAANPKRPHSKGGNVEMRHLTSFAHLLTPFVTMALVDQLETQLATSRVTAKNLLEALVAEITLHS